jgi:hypothetical protein
MTPGNLAIVPPVFELHLPQPTVRKPLLDFCARNAGMAPMRILALCLLVFTTLSFAATSEGAPELEKLRASYKAAIAKGAKPVFQAHIATLEKLRDIYARGSNLAGATKVQADIDRANVAMTSGEFIPPTADANNVSAAELDKLRAGHEADMERVTKPYRETYLRELDKLRDTYTRAANLAAANEVQAEIDEAKAGGLSKAKAAKSAADRRQPRLSGKAPKSEWYIGKSWAEVNGPGPTWTFAKGGKGEVKHSTGGTAPLTWEVMPNGLLKVQHEQSTGVGKVSIYIFISSATEGICGIGTETLTRPLLVK